MPDKKNYRRSIDYREKVALFLRLYGLSDARPTPINRPSQVVLHEYDPGHVVGVPGFVLYTQDAQYARPGETLDDARAAADIAGTDFAALIMSRSKRELEDQFAVLRLGDFANLLVELQEARS